MDKFSLTDNIKVMCLSANQFPEGIAEAHQQLREKLPHQEDRRFFGISRPGPDGKITYKAAAEELREGETEALGLEPFTIEKGHYNSFYLKDFKQDPNWIREAFEILLGQDEVDPNGYCLEWYIGTEDVKCLVPIDENQSHFKGLNNEKI